jgi:hypothetical protein
MSSVEKWLNYLKNAPPPPRLAPLLNKKIDELLHPLAERSRAVYLLDSLAHTVVEQADSLVQSLYKVVKYNLDKMLRGERSEESSV